MGYRSDVHIVIYGEPDRMDAYTVRCQISNLTSRFNRSCGTPFMETWIKVWKHRYKAMVFTAESIKWYDEFEFVELANQMMQLTTAHGVWFEFIRLGENNDDIEQRNSEEKYEGLLMVRREIIHDYSEINDPTEEKEEANG